MLSGALLKNTTGVHAEWMANPATIPGDWLQRESAKGYVQWRPHREDIIDEIQAADVVVLPSYYSEGVPRSLIEAMACGTPVIAWARGSVPEIVEDGVTGIVVQSLDEALDRLPEALALDRGHIRRRFEARFTAARMAVDMCALYDSVLNRSKT